MSLEDIKDANVASALTKLSPEEYKAKESQIINETRNALLAINGDEYIAMSDAQETAFYLETKTRIARKVLGIKAA